MSLDVGSLSSRLTLDISDFLDGMRQAAEQATQLTQILQSALGTGFSQGSSAMQRQLADMQESARALQMAMHSFNASMNEIKSATAFIQVQQVTSSLRSEIAQLTQDTNTLKSSFDTPIAAQLFTNVLQQNADVISSFASVREVIDSFVNSLANISGLTSFESLRTSAQSLLGTLDSLKVTVQSDILSGMQSSVDGVGTSFLSVEGIVKQVFANIRAEVDATLEKITQLKTEIQSLGDLNITPDARGLEPILNSMVELEKSVDRVASEIIDLGNMLYTLHADGFTAMSAQVNTLASYLSGATGQAQQLNNTIANAGVTANSAASGLNTVASSAQNAATATAQIPTGTQQATSSTRQLNQQLRNTRNQVQQISKQTRGFGRDLKQIVQGILISQTFYGLAREFQNLVAASHEFVLNMQSSEIAFKYLLKDAEQAQVFMEAISQYALISPLSVQSVTEASRQLMALGFSAQQTLPVLSVLTDTAAVFSQNANDMSNMISRIVLAMGQMKAAGKIAGQELRQLYNAGIPVYRIFKEQLGLTDEQVRNISRLGIDVNTAIGALLKGLAEEYHGAAREFARTIPALFTQIRDSFGQLAYSALQVPYAFVNAWLIRLAESLVALVQITKAYGPGGLFQALFPADLWMPLRNVIGALGQLASVIQILGRIIGTILGGSINLIIKGLSLVLPPISIVIHLFAQLLQWVMLCVPWIRKLFEVFGAVGIVWLTVAAFRTLYKILLAPVVAWVVKQFTALFNILIRIGAFILAHPWTIPFLILGIVLVGVLSRVEAVRDAFSRLWATIQNAPKMVSEDLGLGFDPNQILTPDFTQPTTDIGQYIGAIDGLSDAYGDLADSAEDASKKIEKTFNQSFDEVYTVDPNAGAFEGFTALSDLDLSELVSQLADMSGLMEGLDFTGNFDVDWDNLKSGIGSLGDALEGFGLTMPDFDLKAWGETFWDALKEAFTEYPEWLAIAIGTALIALLSAITGLPGIVTALAALAYWLYHLLWESIADQFGLVPSQEVASIIGSALVGLIVGVMAGGPAGLIAAAIMLLVNTLLSMLIAKLAEVFGKSEADMNNAGIGQLIGTAIGAVIGAIIGGPVGAVIGGAIGNLAGGIVGLFWNDLVAWFQKDPAGPISIGVGTGIGAFIGLLIGGPAGAAIGAGIGALAQGLFTLLFSKIAEAFGKDMTDTAAAQGSIIGGAIGMVIGMVLGGPAGAAIGAAIGLLAGGIVGIFWDDITAYFKNTASRFADAMKEMWGSVASKFDFKDKNILEIGINIVAGILEGIGAAIATILLALWDFLVKPIIDAVKKLFGIASPAKEMVPIGEYIVQGIFQGIAKAVPELIAGIGAWATSVIEGFAAWTTGVLAHFNTWFTDTKAKFVTWFSETKSGFIGWVKDTGDNISSWASTTSKKVGDWITDTGKQFAQWIVNGTRDFAEWASKTGNEVAQWSKKTVDDIKGWVSTTTDNIKSWATNTWNNIKDWARDTNNSFSQWRTDVGSTITTWSNNTFNQVKDWSSKTLTEVTKWVADTINKFSQWASDTLSKVTTWVSNTQAKFNEWKTNTYNTVSSWVSDTINKIASWVTDVQNKITSWSSNVQSQFNTWRTNVFNTVQSWVTDVINKFASWVTDIQNKVTSWSSTVQSSFNTWRTNVFNTVSSWVSDTVSKFSSWASDVVSKVSSGTSDMLSKVNSFTSSAKSSFEGWWSSTKTGFVGFWSSLVDTAESWGKSLLNTVKKWVQDIIDWFNKLIKKSEEADDAAGGKGGLGEDDDKDFPEPKAPTPRKTFFNFPKPINDSPAGGFGGLGDVVALSRNLTPPQGFAITTPMTGVGGSLREPANTGGISEAELMRFAAFIVEQLGTTLESILTQQYVVEGGETAALPPMYVGTLIADDKGLRELYQRFKLIETQDAARGQVTGGIDYGINIIPTPGT